MPARWFDLPKESLGWESQTFRSTQEMRSSTQNRSRGVGRCRAQRVAAMAMARSRKDVARSASAARRPISARRTFRAIGVSR